MPSKGRTWTFYHTVESDEVIDDEFKMIVIIYGFYMCIYELI